MLDLQCQLSTGHIAVTALPGSPPLPSLLGIAERRNPKRSFLFVSKVLGRHIPVAPATMRSVFEELASRIPADLPGPILVVGMAETAVGLGAGVFRALSAHREDTFYLCSTRHPVDADLMTGFQEAHSHATDHLLYWPMATEDRARVRQARTLILVDDEATTGATFANLLGALVASATPDIERLVSVTLTDWSGDSLARRTALPVTPVSLAFGAWHWAPIPDAPLPEMPPVNVTARGNAPILGPQSWGRLGMRHAVSTLGGDITASAGESVLVLGSSEFVWEPFLLAERLEQAGASVHFGSTSRSPIAVGHAIKTAMAFSDNYGLGIPNFLYNVADRHYDRICLCVETPASSVDPSLLAQLADCTSQLDVVTYE